MYYQRVVFSHECPTISPGRKLTQQERDGDHMGVSPKMGDHQKRMLYL